MRQDAVVIVVRVLSSLGASLGNGTAEGCSNDRRAGALLVRHAALAPDWQTVVAAAGAVVIVVLVLSSLGAPLC
jgi:hypothetical protein